MKRTILIVVIAAICIVGVTALIFFYPRADLTYFKKVISKIGAPQGYTTISPLDDFRAGGLGADPYARRLYSGNNAMEVDREEMLSRVKQAGFKNAQWQNEDFSKNQAAGILATCKGMAVFVRIHQKDDAPVDVEVFKAAYPHSPFCPWL